MRLVWPAYFADPDNVAADAADADVGRGVLGRIKEMTADTDQIAAALTATEVPYGVLAGAASPMPWGQAARATAELSPHAFLKVIPAAGHFPWLDEPGCVRDAAKRVAPARARA